MTELSIEERLDRLESVDAIRQLKYAYAQACDNNFNVDEMTALFIPDGVWENPSEERLVGRDAIKAYFSSAPQRIPYAAHLMVNADIAVDGDSAHGRWWMLQPSVQVIDGVERAFWFGAEYDETYQRVDGRWYFAHLVCNPRFGAPSGEDWAANWRETREHGVDGVAAAPA